jgi:hypothetical protein
VLIVKISWEPQPPRYLRACSGLYRDGFALYTQKSSERKVQEYLLVTISILEDAAQIISVVLLTE